MSLLEEMNLDPEDFTWKDLGLCKDAGVVINEDGTVTDLMYDTYESSPADARQTDDMCLHCPVFTQCYKEGAKGEWGVWGAVYWNGAGRPDRNRNSHKTPEVWDKIKKRLEE